MKTFKFWKFQLQWKKKSEYTKEDWKFEYYSDVFASLLLAFSLPPLAYYNFLKEGLSAFVLTIILTTFIAIPLSMVGKKAKKRYEKMKP